MNYYIKTQPVAEPISLTEAKLHLRVDGTADDALIGLLITAAREFCESYEHRAYMVKTIVMTDDDLREHYLPFSPVIGIDSITYVDSAGDTQTVTATVYDVLSNHDPAAVILAYNQTWPSVRGHTDDVKITYKAGYATTAVPTFGSDILTVGNAIFTDADIVRLSTDQGDLPAPLAANTDYHVRDVSGSTLKLSATAGGAAITLTDDGTGTHYIGINGIIPARVRAAIKLVIGHLYEHRESVTCLTVNELPQGVKDLLSERTWI